MIWVVDDNRDVAMSTAELLRAEGLGDVREFHSAAEVFEALMDDSRGPDLMLLDVGGVGGANGLIREVKADRTLDHTKILIFTGLGEGVVEPDLRSRTCGTVPKTDVKAVVKIVKALTGRA